MTPLQLQKWGLKYDGSSKSVSVEEFIFRAESLRVDYVCSLDVFIKGFHHLLTGRAFDWTWQFRQQNPLCENSALSRNLELSRATLRYKEESLSVDSFNQNLQTYISQRL